MRKSGHLFIIILSLLSISLTRAQDSAPSQEEIEKFLRESGLGDLLKNAGGAGEEMPPQNESESKVLSSDDQKLLGLPAARAIDPSIWKVPKSVVVMRLKGKTGLPWTYRKFLKLRDEADYTAQVYSVGADRREMFERRDTLTFQKWMNDPKDGPVPALEPVSIEGNTELPFPFSVFSWFKDDASRGVLRVLTAIRERANASTLPLVIIVSDKNSYISHSYENEPCEVYCGRHWYIGKVAIVDLERESLDSPFVFVRKNP